MSRPKKRTSFRVAALSFIAILLVVTACGSSSETASDTATTEDVGDSSAATSTATQEPDESDVSANTATEGSDESDDSTSTVIEETNASDTTTDTWDGPNIDLFFDGALAEEVTTEDCTLSGGTVTTCYRVTVAGYPADYDVGPFCPDTIETSADEAGIWFDGDGLYDLDGEFIVGLADLYGDSNWKLYDEDGNVYVTDTPEAFEAAARPDVDPQYQNYCVEGQMEWLEGGEPVPATVLLPTTPVLADSPSQSRQSLGVTLNGVTIAVAAPVDAILGAYTIAAFDDCGGHINPFEGYHLHGAVGCGEVEVEDHANIFGYAADGYAIFSPYDEDGQVYDDLDSCGGHTTDGLGYHYHAFPAAENAVIGCLSGEIAVTDRP